MKKFFILLAITFLALNVNAQWFIAGSVGLDVRNVEQTITLDNGEYSFNNTEIGFSIAPKTGYYFNDKFAVGLSLSVGPNFTIYADKDDKYRQYAVSWRVFPFVRYSVFTYKKFSIILEGRTGVGGDHYFWKLNDEKIEKEGTTLAIGILNVTPILGFNLTDRIQVEAGLHFLNLGYNIDITKREEMPPYQPKARSTKHDFNIGFNSSSILVMTRLQFGVIYKFNTVKPKMVIPQ
jgi:hypothetical protein